MGILFMTPCNPPEELGRLTKFINSKWGMGWGEAIEKARIEEKHKKEKRPRINVTDHVTGGGPHTQQ